MAETIGVVVGGGGGGADQQGEAGEKNGQALSEVLCFPISQSDKTVISCGPREVLCQDPPPPFLFPPLSDP